MGGITQNDAWRKTYNKNFQKIMEKVKRIEPCEVLDGQYIVHACKVTATATLDQRNISVDGVQDLFIRQSLTMVVYNDETIHLDEFICKQWHWHLQTHKDRNWSNTKEIYGNHSEELAQTTIWIQAQSIVSKMSSKHHWEKVKSQKYQPKFYTRWMLWLNIIV